MSIASQNAKDIQQLCLEMKQLNNQSIVLNAENESLKQQCNQIETYSSKKKIISFSMD